MQDWAMVVWVVWPLALWIHWQRKIFRMYLVVCCFVVVELNGLFFLFVLSHYRIIVHGDMVCVINTACFINVFAVSYFTNLFFTKLQFRKCIFVIIKTDVPM
jgi:hypothetical protein